MSDGNDNQNDSPFDFENVETLWRAIDGQLSQQMPKGDYSTWVASVQPISLENERLVLGTANAYGRDFVAQRLTKTIKNYATGLLGYECEVEVVVVNKNTLDTQEILEEVGEYQEQKSNNNANDSKTKKKPRKSTDSTQNDSKSSENLTQRQIAIRSGYSSESAEIVKPDRFISITRYFWEHWRPVLGKPATEVIITLRSLCFYNPVTKELRNRKTLTRTELADLCGLSSRSIARVLADPLVQKYFISTKRYTYQTDNGEIRCGGLIFDVKMDDQPVPPPEEIEKIRKKKKETTDKEMEEEKED